MEILIVVCLAVLVSVFIVKFCIKGESGGSEKDSGALYYSEKTEDIVEKTEKSLEAFCYEVIKDEKEKIKNRSSDKDRNCIWYEIGIGSCVSRFSVTKDNGGKSDISIYSD